MAIFRMGGGGGGGGIKLLSTPTLCIGLSTSKQLDFTSGFSL